MPGMSCPRWVTAATPVAAVIAACAGAGVAVCRARAGGTSDRGSALALAVTIVLTTVAGCVIALARPGNRVGWVLVTGRRPVGRRRGRVRRGGARDRDAAGLGSRGGRPGRGWRLGPGGRVDRRGGRRAGAVPGREAPGRAGGGSATSRSPASRRRSSARLLDVHVENLALAGAGWRNPLPVPTWVSGLGNLLATLSLPLMAATVLGSAAGMVHRWRHGGARLRRQLLVLARHGTAGRGRARAWFKGRLAGVGIRRRRGPAAGRGGRRGPHRRPVRPGHGREPVAGLG